MRFLVCSCAMLLLWSCGPAKKEEEEAVKATVEVKTAAAETATIPHEVSAPATLFPKEQANVTARLTSPIRELRVKKGDTVRAGQVLAVLENRDVAAQQQEARAAVADAQASLSKTTSGTLPSDVERARGAVETARAALNLAQRTFERRQQLFTKGAIPQRDLAQTEAEYSTAKTNFEVAQKSLELLQGQSSGRDIDIAKSRVDQAQARLSGASANLQYSEIRSPFSGVITEQFQYPGDMAQPANPIYTVMDLSTITARAQVPESEVAGVLRGQSCTFESGDLPGVKVSGKVTVVNRAMDVQRRTVEVWCEVSKPPATLRAGLFGDVKIQTGEERGLLVPQSAVQFDEGTRRGAVMVVYGGAAHRREVEAGDTVDNKVHIKKGLQPGDQVIVEGGYGVPDGTSVQAKK